MKYFVSRSFIIFTLILTHVYCQDQYIDVSLDQTFAVIWSSFITNVEFPLRVNITGNVNPNDVRTIQSPFGEGLGKTQFVFKTTK